MNTMNLINSDCILAMSEMPDNSVDSIVTDPPYELGFMGKSWDSTGIAFNVEVWREALRVLKPGGHLLAFSGSRTYHRMAVAIEDAGFEIRDQIMWVYGSGFPKSHNISKGIDKRGGADIGWFGEWLKKWRIEKGITQKTIAVLFPSKTGNPTGCVANWELGLNLPTAKQFSLICETFNLPFASIEEAEREVVGKYETDMGGLGGERLGDAGGNITAPATPEAQQWDGWGTALKPAHEPIVLARKPLIGTVANNVLTFGTGGLNIDGTRVGTRQDEPQIRPASASGIGNGGVAYGTRDGQDAVYTAGRFPANFIHDGSDEVLALFPDTKAGIAKRGNSGGNNFGSDTPKPPLEDIGYGDSGSAARFFYCAKASKRDRNEGLDEAFQAKKSDTRDAVGAGIWEQMNAAHKNHHPTVKPTDLMRYLVRLITPPNGTVLDPFMGSGSTGKACAYEGFDFIGIDMSAEYLEIAKARIAFIEKHPEQVLFPKCFEREDLVFDPIKKETEASA